MARTVKKNPDKVCPRGRRKCAVCKSLGRGESTKHKDDRRDAGRSEVGHD